MALADVTTTGAHLADVIVNTNIPRCADIRVKRVAREGRNLKFGRVDSMLFSVTVSAAWII
jgi:hypothetical protein